MVVGRSQTDLGGKIAGFLLKRRKLVIAIWIVFIIFAGTLGISYTHYTSYSFESSGPPNSQSSQVQSIISSTSQANSTLFVVINSTGNYNSSYVARAVLEFQANVTGKVIPDFSKTESAFSEYSNLIDESTAPYITQIREMYNFSESIMFFPANLFHEWEINSFTYSYLNHLNNTEYGFNRSVVSNAILFYKSKFNGSAQLNYNQALLTLNYSIKPSVLTNDSFDGSIRVDPVLALVLNESFEEFLNSPIMALYQVLGNFNQQGFLTPELLSAMVMPGNPGMNYVYKYGLLGAPSFITDQFVSKGIYLVDVVFDVPSGYRGPNDYYPAQIATPTLRSIADRVFSPFGLNSGVAGSGAVSYDTQVAEASSGFLFSLLFIFLFIAVALILRSALAPVVSILLSSVGIFFGYLAITVTGYFIGNVSYIVDYTIEAVILGVSTDYLIFYLSRFREEVNSGKDIQQSFISAVSSSSPAILTSSLTIAVGLGALSFLPALTTWGPVLFLSVLLTGLMEATLLPLISYYAGRRMFLRRYMKPTMEHSDMTLYKVSKKTLKKPAVVIFLILIIMLPLSIYSFLVPTTYNFNEGLPSNFPSVKAQNEIYHAFGEGTIFPTIVLAHYGNSDFLQNGSVNNSYKGILKGFAEDILSTPGVYSVVGPYAGGKNITNSSDSSSFFVDNGKYAYYFVVLDSNPFSQNALNTVKELRANSNFLVGGVTASVLDQQTYNNFWYSIFKVLIIILIGIVIGLAFRSFSYPVISLTGILLSIFTTTTLLYLISRYILHTALIYIIPFILFVILISLGNDYTVFILSRISEEMKKGERKEAISKAMARSGNVVISLGVILAVSLGSLGLQPVVFLQQLGISFVISLILDTFIIILFYFPVLIFKFSRSKRLHPP